MNASDKAIVILNKTNDGNELAPKHLSLLQAAVNGMLSDDGKKAFDTLYEQIQSGKYETPWLFEVENVTMNHQGYVFWRGIQIEHFTMWDADSRAYLREYTSKRLAPACLALEAANLPVTWANVSAQYDRTPNDITAL